MPSSGPIEKFNATDPDPGASRLNQFVTSLNATVREFNERELSDDDYGPRPIPVMFRLTSTRSGEVGRYNAKLLHPPAVTVATGNLAESNLGTIATSEDCIAWHTPETALGGTHILAVGTGCDYTGYAVGVGTGNKAIIAFCALPLGSPTSPTTINAASEGSEAASSTTWARTGTPLDLWCFCRVGFFHAGDKKLYGYARKLSFDGCGLLTAVSGETRVEIDAPEACP